MKLCRITLLLWVVAAFSLSANAQALVDSKEDSAGTVAPAITYPERVDLTYIRPTEKTSLRNYVFDAFGPYPIVGATLAAGINQADNTPPEWKQGFEGYGKRVGS